MLYTTKSMDKKSKILIALVVVATLFSAAVLYKKIMMQHNFEIIQTESGIPEVGE